MKIGYDGQVHELDLEKITLKQAMAIQSYTGTSIMDLFDQLKNTEKDTPELFKAVGAIYWLMHNQAGREFPIHDTDFPLVPFLTALFTAMAADESASVPAPEAEPGPTVPSPAASVSPPALPSLAPGPNGQTEVTAPLTVS